MHACMHAEQTHALPTLLFLFPLAVVVVVVVYLSPSVSSTPAFTSLHYEQKKLHKKIRGGGGTKFGRKFGRIFGRRFWMRCGMYYYMYVHIVRSSIRYPARKENSGESTLLVLREEKSCGEKKKKLEKNLPNKRLPGNYGRYLRKLSHEISEEIEWEKLRKRPPRHNPGKK